MDHTFAQIQAIQVDANDVPGAAPKAGRKLGRRDIDLAVNTAKDLTVNKGGLLDKDIHGDKASAKLQFALVDAVRMPRPDNNPPLDERVRGVVFDTAAIAAQSAAHDLPDIPVQAETAPLRLTPLMAKEQVPQAPAEGQRHIQIGSFGTYAAAQSAWEDLRDRYPGVERYRPAYERVVTASGRTMVRLKVGPVDGEAQARGLCDRLDIHDNWCAKAG